MAEKKKIRKVTREGQRWIDDRAGTTLRLPLELREAVTEEAGVKGGLARIVPSTLSHVDRKDVEIQQTCKAGLPLFSPQLLHVGADARTALREWAEEERVSVNAIVVSALEHFFERLKEQSAERRPASRDPGKARILTGLNTFSPSSLKGLHEIKRCDQRYGGIMS